MFHSAGSGWEMAGFWSDAPRDRLARMLSSLTAASTRSQSRQSDSDRHTWSSSDSSCVWRSGMSDRDLKLTSFSCPENAHTSGTRLIRLDGSEVPQLNGLFQNCRKAGPRPPVWRVSYAATMRWWFWLRMVWVPDDVKRVKATE